MARKSWRVSATLSFIGAVLAIPPAWGQLAPEWKYCTGSPDIDWNTQIRTCTTLIDSTQEKVKNRSIAYINRGLAYYTLKNFNRSISDNTQAINLDPQSVIAYHNRGLAHKNSGLLEAALSDYSEAIRLDSRYATAYVARGNVYSIKGDPDRAIADYNEAIRYNPEVLAYYNRGLAYYDKKNYDQAIADYSEAIRLDPRYSIAFYNRGIVFERKENYVQAVDDFRKALDLNPHSDEARAALARLQDSPNLSAKPPTPVFENRF